MRQLVGAFPATEYPDMLVGLHEPDDAAVYRLDNERALVNTIDFFTPIVDDPWTYGAIAAANAMSDIYAMGGDVLFCLNIAGFPEDLPQDEGAQIIAGGASKVRQAGAVIAGGHTVTNPEPFYGLSVTGQVHPDRIMRKGGARPGDRLFLTKPLGTGIITTAAKLSGAGESSAHRLARNARQQPGIDPDHLAAAVDSMLHLNRRASKAAQVAGVLGATDITGFGLLGHATEMARASYQQSGAGLRLIAAQVPMLPGALAYIRAGYLTRGSSRNPAAFGEYITFSDSVPKELRTLLWEAETSGGLLLSVAEDRVENFLEACHDREQPVWEVGRVVATQGIFVE